MSIYRLSRRNVQGFLGFALGLTMSFVLLATTQLTRVHRLDHGLHGTVDRGVAGPLEQRTVKCPADDAGDAKVLRFEDLQEHHDDDRTAKDLANRIRVLVWVMTDPQNLDKKAEHVRNTWGKRADKLLFMSSEWNYKFPTIGLDVPEGRDHLTAKTMKAFRYVYEHHVDDADWFMKVDDDTYVIMENLRYMLSAYNTQEPVYFGKLLNFATKQGYASGGAGYVLSKEALRRLARRGFSSYQCRQDGGAEDAEMGICLYALGVKLLPSTDRLGRSRFHCFSLQTHMKGTYPDWYPLYDSVGSKAEVVNISDYPISFHYVKPKMMYAMDYLVYHLRPYGIVSGIQHLNRNGSSINVIRR